MNFPTATSLPKFSVVILYHKNNNYRAGRDKIIFTEFRGLLLDWQNIIQLLGLPYNIIVNIIQHGTTLLLL